MDTGGGGAAGKGVQCRLQGQGHIGPPLLETSATTRAYFSLWGATTLRGWSQVGSMGCARWSQGEGIEPATFQLWNVCPYRLSGISRGCNLPNHHHPAKLNHESSEWSGSFDHHFTRIQLLTAHRTPNRICLEKMLPRIFAGLKARCQLQMTNHNHVSDI